MLHDNLPTNKVAGSSLVFGFFETGSSVDSSTSSEDSSTLRFLESFSSSSESLSESESESEDEDEDEDESESDSDDDDEDEEDDDEDEEDASFLTSFLATFWYPS